MVCLDDGHLNSVLFNLTIMILTVLYYYNEKRIYQSLSTNDRESGKNKRPNVNGQKGQILFSDAL